MSGNIETPLTSSSPPPDTNNNPETTNFPARLRQIRQLLHRERERVRANQEATESVLQSLLGDNSNMPSRRRRANRRPASSGEDNDLFQGRPSNPPAAATLRRPRMSLRERYQILRRQGHPATRSRTESIDTDDLRPSDLDVSSLAELLDPTISIPRNPTRREPPDVPQENRRRAKRRKLDHDGTISSEHGTLYGHFGQVVPGKLRMEIVSCDGGEFSGDATALYSPDNVLRDDSTVYCTKSSRCNLLLRHPGEIPFTLEKIIIKAPERGFTAPVQEGMIFVSMTSDTILQDTAAYQIQYSTSTGSNADWTSGHFTQSLGLPLSNNVFSSSSTTLLERARQRYRGRLPSPGEDGQEWLSRRPTVRLRNGVTRGQRDDGVSSRLAQSDDRELTASASSRGNLDASLHEPPPVIVTMESGHSSSEEEDESSAAFMGDRIQREIVWRGESEYEDDEDDRALPFSSSVLQEQYNIQAGSSGMRCLRASLRNSPSVIGLRDESPERSDPLLAPNARFFIRKDRNKVKIKFDPPISGKFVLLKFWSPLFDGNIDIQHVAAYGYAGPRYFPSIKMR